MVRTTRKLEDVFFFFFDRKCKQRWHSYIKYTHTHTHTATTKNTYTQSCFSIGERVASLSAFDSLFFFFFCCCCCCQAAPCTEEALYGVRNMLPANTPSSFPLLLSYLSLRVFYPSLSLFCFYFFFIFAFFFIILPTRQCSPLPLPNAFPHVSFAA